jgi:hypothetical protein
VLLEHGDGIAREIGGFRTGGQGAVERQIVERECDLELRGSRCASASDEPRRERDKQEFQARPLLLGNEECPHFTFHFNRLRNIHAVFS